MLSKMIFFLLLYFISTDVTSLPPSDPVAIISSSTLTKEIPSGISDIDNRSLAQICLAPLAFPPPGTSIMCWCYYVLAWPIRLCLCLTTPDSRSPKWRRWQGHWIAFLVSCFWIGIFTIFMMWMITIIGTLEMPAFFSFLSAKIGANGIAKSLTWLYQHNISPLRKGMLEQLNKQPLNFRSKFGTLTKSRIKF